MTRRRTAQTTSKATPHQVAFAGALLGCFSLFSFVGAGSASAKEAAYQPHIDPAEFGPVVDNPYFPLTPGTKFEYAETSDDGKYANEIEVTRETKEILGVKCVVVHDVVKNGDKILEDTFDWYAQDLKGNVWYFGEDTKEIHKDGKVNTEGSWQAGVDGAQPGMVMPAKPAPGEPYRQEYLAGEAEDMGQIIAIDESVTVPYGTLTGCVRTKEWSMLESGSEKKWYAKGIGFVREEAPDGNSVLISVTRP